MLQLESDALGPNGANLQQLVLQDEFMMNAWMAEHWRRPKNMTRSALERLPRSVPVSLEETSVPMFSTATTGCMPRGIVRS